MHPTPFLQPLTLTSSFQGSRGEGWAQRQSLALTGDIDLDGDFSPAHVILRPARHVLPIEVTGDIGQGQPQGRQTPRFLGQRKEGKIKKSFS